MVDLRTLGATSCGVWTRRRALTLLSSGQVDAFVRSRVWQVVWRGVYADSGHELDAEQRAWAAVLAVGGALPAPSADGSRRLRLRAVASGRTAARVWRLPLIDDDDPATAACERHLEDVAVDRHLPRQHLAGRSLTPHKTRLHRDEVVQLVSGLWLTTPVRTLLDCASLLTPVALACATDAALHTGRTDPGTLAHALDVSAGRAGSAVLRATVEAADARAESPPETLARLLLLPELPRLEPQVELFDHAARPVARFDLGDRDVRPAVEADGKAAHAGAAVVAKDRRRDRRNASFGWHTERVTWYELRRERAAFVRRVRGVHAQLSARPLR